jgi:hypothetical protein
MGRKSITRIVLGVFGVIVAGYLLGQTISIECERVPGGQAIHEISCTLSTRVFGLIRLNERKVSGITGARLEKDDAGSDDVVYRVVLITTEGEVYPTIWGSSGDISKRRVVDQINQFIQNPDQVELKTTLPSIGFWEKDAPLTLLLIAGILGYYAWKVWKENRKPSREVNVDEFIDQTVPEMEALQDVAGGEDAIIESTGASQALPSGLAGAETLMSDLTATAIERWGGIIAVVLFLAIALLIPVLKVLTLHQEGFPIDFNLVNQIDRVELAILLGFSVLMVAGAIGFAWHTYKNWNPVRDAYDVGPVQEGEGPHANNRKKTQREI